MKGKTRNEQIAELLASGERLKDFYRFTAQNPHIDLHDACQIVLARPKASICFYMDEWNEMGRRVTKNRRGIQFYDTDGTSNMSLICTTRTGISAIAALSSPCAVCCTVWMS